MIKYSFLLAPNNNLALADKPKRNAKVFKKTMPTIIETLKTQHKKTKLSQLLSININQNLKLCSVKFAEKDFIYNIIIKKFPGPSDRFYLKILKEIHQARVQSGFSPTRKDLKRKFEIELKKIIEKFNESEIQYKYFMKKLHIREERAKKASQLKIDRDKKKLKKEEIEGLGRAPRKTWVTSGLEHQINNMKEKKKDESLLRQSGQGVVLVQTGNQDKTSDQENENAVETMDSVEENLKEKPLNKEFNRLVTTGTIQNLQKQTLGLDSGNHYTERKTRMLEEDAISQLRKMNLRPEANSDSENEKSSITSCEIENHSEISNESNKKTKKRKMKPENKKSSEKECIIKEISGIRVIPIEEEDEMSHETSAEEVKIYSDSNIESVNEKDNITITTNHETLDANPWNRKRHGRATQNFIKTLPELDCSEVISVNLNDGGLQINRDLLQFEEEPETRPSHLSKKCCGLIWWNSNKTLGQNLISNLRNNPYFRIFVLVSLFVFLISCIAIAVKAISDD